MSNEAQEFKLLITGDASSAVGAFQKTGDASKKLKVDTSDLGDETKKLLGISTPAADGAKKLGEEIGKSGEHAEKGGREMRRLINEIGNVAGVADLGAVSMGELGVAVFAVGAALEILKTALGNVQQGTNGFIDLQVKDDSATILANATAWNQYAEARRSR